MDVPNWPGCALGAPNSACAKNAGASDAELIILCLMGGSRRKDAYSASLLSFNTLAAGGEATLSFSLSLAPLLLFSAPTARSLSPGTSGNKAGALLSSLLYFISVHARSLIPKRPLNFVIYMKRKKG
jgi:hypothetical protein